MSGFKVEELPLGDASLYYVKTHDDKAIGSFITDKRPNAQYNLETNFKFTAIRDASQVGNRTFGRVISELSATDPRKMATFLLKDSYAFYDEQKMYSVGVGVFSGGEQLVSEMKRMFSGAKMWETMSTYEVDGHWFIVLYAVRLPVKPTKLSLYGPGPMFPTIDMKNSVITASRLTFPAEYNEVLKSSLAHLLSDMYKPYAYVTVVFTDPTLIQEMNFHIDGTSCWKIDVNTYGILVINRYVGGIRWPGVTDSIAHLQATLDQLDRDLVSHRQGLEADRFAAEAVMKYYKDGDRSMLDSAEAQRLIPAMSELPKKWFTSSEEYRKDRQTKLQYENIANMFVRLRQNKIRNTEATMKFLSSPITTEWIQSGKDKSEQTRKRKSVVLSMLRLLSVQ